MNVSAGLADGWRGGIFSVSMLRNLQNWSIAAELNGAPLSYSCISGLPKLLYISVMAGMTLLAFVDRTSFAAGKREARSCTTTIWFRDGIGPNRSTATLLQFFSGTLWFISGSIVFFFSESLTVFAT